MICQSAHVRRFSSHRAALTAAGGTPAVPVKSLSGQAAAKLLRRELTGATEPTAPQREATPGTGRQKPGGSQIYAPSSSALAAAPPESFPLLPSSGK